MALEDLKKSVLEIKESQAELRKSVDFTAAKFDDLITVANKHTQEIGDIKLAWIL